MRHPELKDYTWFKEELGNGILQICPGNGWHLWFQSLIIRTRKHAKCMGKNLLFLLFLLLQFNSSTILWAVDLKILEKLSFLKKWSVWLKFLYLPVEFFSLGLEKNTAWFVAGPLTPKSLLPCVPIVLLMCSPKPWSK